MAECDGGWEIKPSTRKNLEVDFKGMRYQEADGLNLWGKPRIYTETYADADKTRVWIPQDVTYEPTTITFSFVFLGEDRYKTYDEFVSWVSGKRMAYWDDARNKTAYFYVGDSVQPAEEKWHGSTPYLRLQLKVTNIYGRTFDL
jgi:hypothetical protein